MKTAMQELIEWIDENSPHCKIDSLVREVAEKLLEREQQQIERAWDDVKFNKWGNENTLTCGAHYYKETYNKIDKSRCFECGGELDKEELFCSYCRRQS